MSWMLVVGAICGVLLGLRHRAQAMLVASVAVAAIGTAMALAGGATPHAAVIAGASALGALQAAYLATLTLPVCLRAIMRSRAG